jgi:hypothetical protein
MRFDLQSKDHQQRPFLRQQFKHVARRAIGAANVGLRFGHIDISIGISEGPYLPLGKYFSTSEYEATFLHAQSVAAASLQDMTASKLIEDFVYETILLARRVLVVAAYRIA